MNGKLKELRERKNLTQAELARKIGVNRSYISRIESGKSKPSLALLERIANELGISVKKFF